MLLLGDVCIEERDKFFFDNNLRKIFKSNKSFCNLEGPINVNKKYHTRNNKMHNSSKIIDVFKNINMKGVTLCNNHIFDWGDKAVLKTIEYLEENGVNTFGYKYRSSSKLNPLKIIDNEISYSFYSFGWPVISCRRPSFFSPGINPLDNENINFYIREILPGIPKKAVKVVFMHWCYEMDPYIQPLHRDFSKKLIDCGVDFVIGSHSHVIGPIEKYNKGYIIHSLGNFLFSSNKFCNGKLSYPSNSNYQIMVEINSSSKIKVHTILTKKNKLKILRSENINAFISSFPEEISSFSSKKYYEWYKNWSKKNSKFLPIFSSNNNFLNNVFSQFLILRMLLIKILILLGLKNPGKRRKIKNKIIDFD